MSTAHDSHDAAAHDPGAHDAHTFDGEPARELAPGEPPTPAWIPALGAALFLAGGLTFIATASESNPAGGAPAATQEAAPGSPPSPPPTPPTVVSVARPSPAAPGSPPSLNPALQRLTPEQRELLLKKVQGMQAGQNGSPPAGHP